MAWAQNGRSIMDTFGRLVFTVCFGLYCAAPHRRPVDRPHPPYGGLLGFVWMNGKRLLGLLVASLLPKGWEVTAGILVFETIGYHGFICC